ncbi:hypothetical protein CASFOL_035811 [Castilleja foliolosa]|uniref:BZIP domain-containing protein n=1 Tax=Castilleja foliolosa TaxID=1961234 RepID=A0ABD3BUL1_9LAMI
MMASSRVMASWSPSNPDLPRQPSPPRSDLETEPSRGFGSMNFDDILRNICSDPQPLTLEGGGGGVGDRTAEEVWSDIVNGGEGEGGREGPAMTLENFLSKAGAVDEEDIRVSAAVTMPPSQPAGGFVMEAAAMVPATGLPVVQFAPAMCVPDGMMAGGFGAGFGNGMAAVSGGRGKRKATVDQVPDKATQQRQKRMIKNRESAARSRERKQAYTEELETLVAQLEEDNARLLKEEAEMNKERYKQLIKNIIPVTEKPRPPRVMKKVRSMEW